MKLYLITREHRYDGGRGCDQLNGQELVYCGYDREEAFREYHASKVSDSLHVSPGRYYYITVARSRPVGRRSAVTA